MCEAICEEVQGSEQFIRIRRKRDHGDTGGQANGRFPIGLVDGCYKFQCSCPFGRKIGWIGNMGWNFYKFDGDKHCAHLFGVLTIYEHERNIRRGIILDNEKDVHEVRALNVANKIFNYRLLEKKFSQLGQQRPMPIGEREIKLIDESYKHTVKCSTGRDPVWECTCKGFKFWGHCKHINYVKSNEIYKQHRRELGISLALKYVTEK